MDDSQGRARGQDLGNADARGLTRGHGLVLVLVLKLARGHPPDRGRGRAIGVVDTESALADLAPEVGPRVAVAAWNAKGGEREVARRMYVFLFLVYSLLWRSYLVASTEGEKRKEEKWDVFGRCFRRTMGQIRYY